MNIQAQIDAKLIRPDRTPSGKISPSDLGRCFRYQYWHRKGEKPTNPPDERALRVFKAGELFHDFVKEVIGFKDVERKIEQADILGYADIVLDDEVIDIKSIHSRGFHYMRESKFDINVDKEPNILQVVCYAWLLNKPKARLVFVSKDDLCISEYGFSTEKWLPKLQEELKTIRDNWAKDKLPEPKPRAYGGKECKYCPYGTLCKPKGQK